MSLNEDSTYTITVTAVNDEGSRSSTITPSSPSGGPSSVTDIVVGGVTTISIEWNEVECADHVESSAITSLTSDSPDGFTLILNWQPPNSPNGDILNYTVRHSDGVRISEQNVSNTTFTTTSLRLL